MNLKIKWFILLSVVILRQASFGQNMNAQNLTNINPPTPEAAAFAKYVDMPVGYSTGSAQVNIPLYTITNDQLSVPISLSYNTSGIKVEEAATWVGLGWNLSAGGSLTRIVRGLPDDYDTSGYMYTAETVNYLHGIPYNSDEFSNQLSLRAYTEKVLDVEPDIYIYSILGHNGKFYYDQVAHQFVQTPYQAVKIQYVLDGTKIKGWTLTFPDGVTAYLGLSKDASRTGYDTFNSSSSFSASNNGNVDPPGGGETPSHITGWQLMDIVEPAGHSMKFYYTSYLAADFGRGGETEDYRGGTICDALTTDRITASFYKQYSTKTYINRISTELGDVYFIPSQQDRLDVLAEPTATKSLDSIVIKNKSGQVIKSFSFNYGYFVSTDITAVNGMYDVTDASSRRLFLRSVIENSSSGDDKLPYRFYYDTANILPNRLSTAQDYWGYYNHKSNGNFLTPQISIATVYPQGYGYYPGADRSVDFTYAKACTLTKIVYPTGGSTEYFFEKNTVSTGYNNYMTGYRPPEAADKYFVLVKSPVDQLPGDPSTYQDTLTINNISGPVNISSTITGCTTGGAQTDDCHVQFFITGITDNTYYQTFQANDFNQALANGKYLVRAQVTDNPDDPDHPADFTLAITWEEVPNISNYTVGGLRISKIINSDNVGGTLVKRLSYQQFADTSKSSGELINVPVYKLKIACGSNGASTNPSNTRVFSNSIVPLASLDGQFVHYSNVSEYYNEGNCYKTEFEFSSDYYGLIDPSGTNYPPPTHVERDWRRDLLLNKRVYEMIGEAPGYRVLQSEIHNYTPFQSIDESIPFGIKTAPYIAGTYFGYTFYNFTSEWFLEDSVSTTQSTYLANGSAGPVLTTYTKKMYDPYNYYLLANSRMMDSKGELVEKKIWYAADYSDIPGSSIPALKQNYFVGLPVKQQTSRGAKLMEGHVTLYNNLGLPVNTYTYENASLADTVTHNVAILVPNNYQLKQTASYSGDFNNLGELVSWNSPNTSYVWDYQGSYPVAKVLNANSADIAYTSFEADNTGGWYLPGGSIDTTKGITGRRSFVLATNMSKAALNASTTYIVSYWTQNRTPFTIPGELPGYPKKGKSVTINATTWTFYIHKITGLNTALISGSGPIDEVRLYPASAQMTTYTYDPLIGMTSQCDVNNRITYYQYDALTRLKRIRDQDYNILKSYDYQYQAQSGCGGNCAILTMQTFTGSNTIGYPVGVFNVQGKLIGNASGSAQYVSLWNSDAANAAVGTLAAGADGLHFNLSLNAGKTAPAGVIGCRFYQWDLPWNIFDGVGISNGAYVDFGDGTKMPLPKTATDTVGFGSSTTLLYGYYVVHTYADASGKTITVYHNDSEKDVVLDNANSPATSLSKIQHLRGNFPQGLTNIKFSSMQQSSAVTMDSIYNWNSISSVQALAIATGDGGTTPCKNIHFAQDFMKNNTGLLGIYCSNGHYYASGTNDTTFKLKKLKTDWNTWFTNLQQIVIQEDQWDHEDLSALSHLNLFVLTAATIDHTNASGNNPVAISPAVLDGILTQIAAGAGQSVTNGTINLITGGSMPGSAGNAAAEQLRAKGWTVLIHY